MHTDNKDRPEKSKKEEVREKKMEKETHTHTRARANSQTHERTKLPIIPSIGRNDHHTNQDMAQNTFKE